jgi:two-component system chemotaxis response regulator CheY
MPAQPYFAQVTGTDSFVDVRAGTARKIGSVLVVDDQTSMRAFVTQLLREIGVQEIGEAANGPDAFKLMHERKWDVVLCDIEMAPVDGLTLLKGIRGTPQFASQPVILMTASRSIGNVRAAERLRATGVMVKPFTSQQLREKLSRPMG